MLNENLERFEKAAKSNSDIKEPITAEDFARLDYMSQFTLKMKWIHEEMIGITNVYEKLKFFDKKLNKTTYCLFNKQTGEFENEFDSEYDLKKYYKLEDSIYSYLKRVSKNNTIKNPKYDIYYKYRIAKKEYILKDNDYVLAE